MIPAARINFKGKVYTQIGIFMKENYLGRVGDNYIYGFDNDEKGKNDQLKFVQHLHEVNLPCINDPRGSKDTMPSIEQSENISKAFWALG